jgi:bacillaene biosynthesis, polyketide synthase / nonribosomal peptide synthetase PksJ/BaeJ
MLSPEKQALLEKRLKGIRAIENKPADSIMRSSQESIPLSYSQQQMWLMEMLYPGNPAYNMAFGFRIKGNLDSKILESSFNEIIKRHSILRTTFSIKDNKPIQVIHKYSDIHISTVDLRNVNRPDAERQIQESASKFSTQIFDLQKLPLLRINLYKIKDLEQVLIVVLHHIVADGWSVNIIMNELIQLYEGYSKKNRLPMPVLNELKIQYSDYAIWSLEELKKNYIKHQFSFWSKNLKDDVPQLELPIYRIRPAAQTFNGSNEFFNISKEITNKLKSLAKQSGSTFFMTFYAICCILLYRYTSQEDIIIGTPVANRNRKEIEPLIGNFINMLALRLNLSSNPTFWETLDRVKTICLEAFSNQDIPFEKVIEGLKIKRDQSRNPIFQVMLQISNEVKINSEDLVFEPFEFNTPFSQLDLSIHLYEQKDGYRGRFEYNTDLFNGELIERMVLNFKKLIKEVVDSPSKNIHEYSIISGAEYTILSKWHNSEVFFLNEKCSHHLFEEQVKIRYYSIAAKYEGRTITYGELNSRANKLANYLIKIKVKKGSLVGICIDRSINMLIGLLAILKTGAAYVPLDPSFPSERLNYTVKDSQLAVIVSEEKLSAIVSQFKIEHVFIDSEWDKINSENDQNPDVKMIPSDLMYIIYTSGSTGNPKGVMIGHHSVVNFLQSMSTKPGFTENDILLAVTTISFDIAGLELFLPLISGGQIVIAGKEDTVDGKSLLNIIDNQKITVLQATPSTWKIMLEADWGKTPKLKMLCGGEAFSKDLADKILDKGNELWNMYGPTETTIWSSVNKIEKDDKEVLIGVPIANTQFYIVDKYLNPVPIGVAGELLIGGEGLARGYWGRKELTEEKFVMKPIFNETRRLYRTGDLVRYRPNGSIEFLGRIDFQVKIRGFRIELGEIESKLFQHKDVKEAAVMVNENRVGEKSLVAYIIPVRKSECKINSLKTFLKEKIPEYMIPSFFIEMEKFPLTLNGKIDRKALPDPANENLEIDKNFVEPSGETEIALTKLWEKILDVNKVGVENDFFEIGGNSLLLMNLKARISKLWGISIPISVLYNETTVKRQAALIELLMGQNTNIDRSGNSEEREVFNI